MKFRITINALFLLSFSYSLTGETDLVSAYLDSASVCQKQLQFDKALLLYEQARKQLMSDEKNNFQLLADVYRKMGRVHRVLKEDKLYLEYVLFSSEILKKYLVNTHQKVAESYNNIGAGYYEIGEYEKALDYYEKTLFVEFKQDTPKVNICYNNIGTTYIKIGEYEKALSYLKKALKGNIEEFGDCNVHVSTALYNIASGYRNMKKYEESIDYYQQSLAMDRGVFGDNHYYLAGTYTELGNVFLRMKNYPKALDNYTKSMEISKQIFGAHHKSVGNGYRNIAITYVRLGKNDSTLQMVQKALLSFAGEDDSQDVLINPMQTEKTYHSDNLRALINKGSILLKIGLKKSSVDTLKAAYNTLMLSSDILTILLGDRNTETSKLYLLKDHKTIYSKAIQVSVALGEMTNNLDYYKSVFKFSELAKAAVISERLQVSETLTYSNIPDSILTRNKSNTRVISLLKNNLLKEKAKSEPDSSLITLWQNDLFDRNRRQENIEKELENTYPGYFKLKRRSEIPTVHEVQNSLDEKTAILEYSVCKSSVVIFVLTKDTFIVRHVPIDSTFASIITEYKNSILNLDLYGFVEKSNALYKLLLEPVERIINSTKKLVIIPEGNLLTIPFEALLTREVREVDFTELPYLIKNYTVGYHLSSQLYVDTKSKSKIETEQYYTAFAPSFDENAEYSKLEHTENEIKTLRRHLGRTGNIYSGEKATKMQFIADVERSNIVHVATHGIINDDEPQLSGLVFAKERGAEDGILYSGEIYNLEMEADLLVLSSCESGVGKLHTGEGIMNLTRGFLYAGARNIMYTQWKIDDGTTYDLMQEFYRNIRENHSYAESLRFAKLKLIRKTDTAFPLSWAGFVLMENVLE